MTCYIKIHKNCKSNEQSFNCQFYVVIILIIDLMGQKEQKYQDENELSHQEEFKVLRRKIIKKQKKKSIEKTYSLIWTPIERILPIKHLLILPGDCIFPLTNISMYNLMEDLYIKNSSIKTAGNLELTLSRKVKPFRNLEQLFPLIEKIQSPYVPKLKQLLFTDWKIYMEKKKSQRRQILTENLTTMKNTEFQSSLFKFLKTLNEPYYRYQVRNSNQQFQMQMKKVGYSQNLISFLYPETTDILVQNTPMIFSNVESYLKYMYYNLESLIKGGNMEWVEIEVETSDQILIETRFKNIYYTSPTTNQLVTITAFEISKNAIEKIQNMRSKSTDHNILIKVNPEAEKFFNKFYSNKSNQPKQSCAYADLEIQN